jgi:transcriptional regulator with XRE-family HTH domain
MMQIVTESKLDTLGDRIAYARERSGLSTAQLARRLGVKSRTLAKWERDETEPRANRLVMLAQLLGVAPAWLFEGQEDYAPGVTTPALAQIKEQLDLAKLTIENLSHIVRTLETMIEQREGRRDAA